MTPYFEAIHEILSHQEYIQILGWILGIAILIGGVLNDGGRQLASWTIAIVSYGLLQEISRHIYWATHAHPEIAITGTAITVIGGSTYLIGLAIGWMIAFIARNRVRHGFPPRHPGISMDRPTKPANVPCADIPIAATSSEKKEIKT